MRSNKVYCFRAYYSKGVSRHHLHLADTQNQAKARENFTVEKGYALTGCFWHEEAVGRLTRSCASNMIG